MKSIIQYIKDRPNLLFFLKYLGLFTMLFVSIALGALYNIVSVESNPFFYANF